MRFIAFFADGSVRDSSHMPWVDLPHDLVVAVWWDENGTRHLDCGFDALINTGTEIVGVNTPTNPFETAARKEAKAGHLKYGVYMDPDAWAEVRALADEARTPPEA